MVPGSVAAGTAGAGTAQDCTSHAQELEQDWGVDLGMVQVPMPAQHQLRLSNGMEPDATSPGFAQIAAVSSTPLPATQAYMHCAYLRRGFTMRAAQEHYSEFAAPDGKVVYLSFAPEEGGTGTLIMVTLYLPRQPSD
ncbi:hypothetical protein [Novosphingobium naphthalenivorans]|uniref:hypothetical protein n=1 Tax=Novosphingobium naphthalenivorans TaxID=273168 RepID=UPI000836A78E|nr:hypothetical protein [Novosphingobium naphthalenivorans]